MYLIFFTADTRNCFNNYDLDMDRKVITCNSTVLMAQSLSLALNAGGR